MASPAPLPSLVPSAPWRLWVAVAAGWTVWGAVTAALFELTTADPEGSLRWSVPVMLAVGAFWTVATPLVAWLTRRLAPERVGRARSLAGHLAAGLALSAACTVARWLAFLALRDDPPPLAAMLGRLLDYHLCMYALVVALTRAGDSHRAFVERSRRALALEAQVARAQLDFLQRQLQPHFLFNTLNVAAELTREAPRTAARMLRQLARLLAAATERLTESEVTLAEELRLLDAYAEVQRTRFGKALDVAYRVPPALGAARVPTLVLQPLLENAIRHGLSSGRGRVVVAGARRGDRLVLTVEDSGAPGRQAEAEGDDGSARVGGIGLRNTRDRLTVLHGDDHTLDLRPATGGGTVAVLELPYVEGRSASPSDVPAGDATAERATNAADGDTVVTVARAGHAWAAAHEPLAAPPFPADAPRVRGATIAGGWALVAASWWAQGALLRAAVGAPVLGGADAVIAPVVAAGTWAALTPLVLRLARAVRVTRDRWAGPLAAHAVLCAVVATAQIALADVLLGEPALPLVAGIVNPLTQSALVYLGLVAWSHARDLAHRQRERAVAAERLAADLEQTTLRARAMELRPAFVVAVLQRAAARAEEEPERVEEVLERLADLLRLVLDEGDAAGGGAPTLREELALLEESLDLLALVSVPVAALDARVASGALRRVLDGVLARAGEAPLAVEVTAAPESAAGAADPAAGAAWRVTARLVAPHADPVAAHVA